MDLLLDDGWILRESFSEFSELFSGKVEKEEEEVNFETWRWEG